MKSKSSLCKTPPEAPHKGAREATCKAHAASRRSQSTRPATRAAICLLLFSLSCSNNSVLGKLASREVEHGRALGSSLPGLAQGEFARAKRLAPMLGAIPTELGRARKIPEILRSLSSEISRPKRGIARILELWSREVQHTRALTGQSSR